MITKYLDASHTLPWYSTVSASILRVTLKNILEIYSVKAKGQVCALYNLYIDSVFPIPVHHLLLLKQSAAQQQNKCSQRSIHPAVEICYFYILQSHIVFSPKGDVWEPNPNFASKVWGQEGATGTTLMEVIVNVTDKSRIVQRLRYFLSAQVKGDVILFSSLCECCLYCSKTLWAGKQKISSRYLANVVPELPHHAVRVY